MAGCWLEVLKELGRWWLHIWVLNPNKLKKIKNTKKFIQIGMQGIEKQNIRKFGMEKEKVC